MNTPDSSLIWRLTADRRITTTPRQNGMMSDAVAFDSYCGEPSA